MRRIRLSMDETIQLMQARQRFWNTDVWVFTSKLSPRGWSLILTHCTRKADR